MPTDRDQWPRSVRRDRLWELAAAQRGYFTAAQAVQVGYSHQAQRFHAQRGNWRRVDRGLYRLREFSVLPGEEHDSHVRWWLWSKGQAVVSHVSALAVHDLGVANPAEIHLTVAPGFRRRDERVVLHRAELRPEEVEGREGFRVTTPLRAIVESAADAVDQDMIDSAVAELLDRGEATRGQLAQAAQRLGSRAELSVERALRAKGT
ncbi:type IV toxin-antitoxin system AbiEi family antitoxin domain-containing protein [Streptosporangium sp. NPDC051022]|uniref:type IV toxin-antitoxin system AbiEi family antitoxin domain-containing protein n=1 Tax=Streptosporangium sp. NPDC051022 TaxID=3155752 RepID=UPI0034499C9D